MSDRTLMALDEASDGDEVVACRVATRSRILVLAPNLYVQALDGFPTRDVLPFLPFRVVAGARPGSVALRHVGTDLFLTSRPDGRLACDRDRAGEDESFDLVESQPRTRALRVRIEWLGRLFGERPTGPRLTRAFRKEARRAGRHVPSLAAILPLADVRDLAREVSRDRRLRRSVLEGLETDPFIRFGLAGVADRLDGKPGPAERTISNEVNFLESPTRSFGRTLNALVRAEIRPTRSLCVLATVRNEGPYLIEWLAYHRVVGVEHFIVYSNDNQDGSDDLLRALATAGIITWIDNRGRHHGSAQTRAYDHALSIAPDVLDFAWCAAIDADEFIVADPERFASLTDYLDWQAENDVDVVGVNWRFMAASDEGWVDAPLIQRCRQPMTAVNNHIKSIFRPHAAWAGTPHHPITDGRTAPIFRDSTRQIHRPWREHAAEQSFTETPCADHALVYHYVFKSAEEFVWKLSRNRGDEETISGEAVGTVPDHFVDFFLSQRSSREAPETWIARSEPAVSAESDRLLALPGIAAARARVLEHFRARLALVKSVLREQPGKPGSPRHELYRLAGVDLDPGGSP